MNKRKEERTDKRKRMKHERKNNIQERKENKNESINHVWCRKQWKIIKEETGKFLKNTKEKLWIKREKM